MTTVLEALLVVLIALPVLGFFVWVGMDGCDLESQLEQEQVSAENAIDEDYQAARRAMNDAVGQSWRNLAE